MWPAFLVPGIGERRRVRIPLPLFLLWPFLILVWLGVGMGSLVGRLLRGDWRVLAGARTVLNVLGHLSGVLVDVRSSDGAEIYLRFV